ncbi:MAG: dTDP-4-dehydrorhamnose 3,5-epimerase [bacterium]|nr:MAG: dTDP-4-dehydrorhamnose 3,5-epimerase [bacterium]
MFSDGEIQGVIIKPLKKQTDERGWLSELFREDELDDYKTLMPAMSYISYTRPGVARGPHEHTQQTDYFCFIGPSDFKLFLWDNRKNSVTYRNKIVVEVGEENPASVIIPEGVVHAYKNIGSCDGAVINFPNRLFMGACKKFPVDEIRHEDDKNSPFKLDE